MKANNSGQFKPRYSLPVACIACADYLWFPLLSFFPRCLWYYTLSKCPDKAIKYSPSIVWKDNYSALVLKEQTATLTWRVVSLFIAVWKEWNKIQKNSIYRNKCDRSPDDAFWGQPTVSALSEWCAEGFHLLLTCRPFYCSHLGVSLTVRWLF